MTTVVSDTSPINYLCLTETIDVLPSLFGEVVIPPTVLRELRHPHAPSVVAKWTQHLPAWVRVQSPIAIQPDLNLDAGEAEAISLALELKARAMLIDEKDGRLAAERYGIQPIGTLFVLAAAGKLGIIDAEAAFLRLRSTSFHVEAKTIEALIAEARGKKP